jgi:hypothetical protein
MIGPMYPFSTGLPDNPCSEIILHHVTLQTVSTSNRNSLWWAILIADNITTHLRITLYPVTAKQFTHSILHRNNPDLGARGSARHLTVARWGGGGPHITHAKNHSPSRSTLEDCGIKLFRNVGFTLNYPQHSITSRKIRHPRSSKHATSLRIHITKLHTVFFTTPKKLYVYNTHPIISQTFSRI